MDGNFSFALVPDATDCSSVVITQPQQEPIPSSLLDARVPASSASTIGDRLGLLFSIHVLLSEESREIVRDFLTLD